MTEAQSIFLVLLSLPFVVYLTVKLGTYAFFRARQQFYLKESQRDGEATREKESRFD